MDTASKFLAIETALALFFIILLNQLIVNSLVTFEVYNWGLGAVGAGFFVFVILTLMFFRRKKLNASADAISILF
jgi:bacteriorhodopsin